MKSYPFLFFTDTIQVFSLCQAVLSEGNDEEGNRSRIASAMIEIASSSPGSVSGPDDDVRKVKLGSIDTIAACITVELGRCDNILHILLERLANSGQLCIN